MAGYKSPFANTKAGKKAADKKPKKKGFFEKMGARWGDAAADYLLEDNPPAKPKKK